MTGPEIEKERWIHTVPLLTDIIFFLLTEDAFLSTCSTLSIYAAVTLILAISKV
jgi:hypothetical protein